MDLKEKLVSSFLAFENNVDVDHPVHDIRSEAIKNFELKGFPNRKDEAWKYTSLTPSLGINQFWPQTILIIGYTLMAVRLFQTYYLWWRDGADGIPGMLEENLDLQPVEKETQS